MADDDFFIDDQDPDGPFALPIATTPTEVIGQIQAELRERVPAWRAVEGAADTNLLAASGTVSAESRAALSRLVQLELLTLLGILFQVPRNEGEPATSSITVTAIDDLGHTLPAPATVTLGDVELETTADLVIPVGQTTGQAPVQTIALSGAANGATGSGAQLEIDAFDWIAAPEDDGVVLDAPLGGGRDPETTLEYGIRLSEELRLLSPKPILPEDFAILARRNTAVGFAWAINLYDVTDGATNKPRAITIVVTDDQGQPLPGPTMTAIQATFVDPITNLLVRVTAPEYVEVDVTGTFVCLDGWDPADVGPRVIARLRDVLSPAGWIALPAAGQGENYQPTRVVHVNELIAQADQVEGVDYIPTMQIGDGSSDHVLLNTPIKLPTPGDVAMTEAP